MKPFFMHTPYSPLARLLETTARAFATGDFDTNTSFGVSFFEDETLIPGVGPGSISGERTEAGHLETNTATHRSGADIFDMSVR